MLKKSICGMTAEEIFDLILPFGFSRAHALSLSNGIYKKSIADLKSVKGIPVRLKEMLSETYNSGLFSSTIHETSNDGSVKFLFRNVEGKVFETVFIPDGKRNTVCVSTQSGCRMGCKYCLTAKYGFHGSLTAGEIVNQVVSLPYAEKVTHVVFMGMGEPMDNIDSVLKACEILTSEWGLALSPRNITVSTVGIMPSVEKFLNSSACNLTLSLYSPFKDEREIIAPIEKRYPAADIIELMAKIPLRKKRRLSIAYMMIKDQNDSDRHLEKLKNLFRATGIRINLLSYHNPGTDNFSPSPVERMQYFKHSLVMEGISASIRKSRGVDISAACGLLAGKLNHVSDF